MVARRLILRTFTAGELVDHVALHSVKHPKHLHGLQEFASSLQTTTYFIDSGSDNAFAAHQNANGSTFASPNQPDESSKSGAEDHSPRRSMPRFGPSERYAMQYLSDSRNAPSPSTHGDPQSPHEQHPRNAAKQEPSGEPFVDPFESMRSAAVKHEFAFQVGGFVACVGDGFPGRYLPTYSRETKNEPRPNGIYGIPPAQKEM